MGTDTAFLDRMHCYLPGWEIPKFRPEHFTNDYGFISDYLAEFIRELRKEQYGDALDHYFRLGRNLNQRDTIAVRRMIDGYLKLMYPNGEFTKEELEEIIQIALEMRRRVKEQLKKLGGMEFYDVNFSYIDLEDMSEHYVSVPEQGGGKLIPDGMCNPGQVYTVSRGKSGMIGVFRLESQMLPGNGKIERTGLGSDSKCKEAVNTAFNYLKANGNRISGAISTSTKDYIINYQDLQGIGMTLTENVTYDQRGWPMENSLMQYKLPTRVDVGRVRVEFENSYEPNGPFGAKSIGEVVINTPLPAISDAIYNAIGTRFYELPITPEKIAMAVAEKEGAVG